MVIKVQGGCRDCKKCTNSVVANFGRNTGRWTAAVTTVGMSEVGFMARKKCRSCGHQLSLHLGVDAHTPQPAVQVQSAPPQREAPSGPPPGWYNDPQGIAGQRWWDGHVWTDHTQG